MSQIGPIRLTGDLLTSTKTLFLSFHERGVECRRSAMEGDEDLSPRLITEQLGPTVLILLGWRTPMN
jgi:hypothetical protein